MKFNKKMMAVVMCLAFAFSLAININGALALTTGLEYATELELGTRDVRSVVMNVINVLMGFLGIIALIIVLTGGFKWMTAGGSEDGIEEAKKLITAGVIGMGIVLSAYAISFFIVDSLMDATS